MVEPESISTYKQVGRYCFDPASPPLEVEIFGIVYKGWAIEDSKDEIAIKVISTERADELGTYFQREIDILKKIKGNHILEFKEVMRGKTNIYIITTLCNGGNLEQKLKKSEKVFEEEALNYLKQIAEAFMEVEQLELKNENGEKLSIMHRDIKPANILIHNGEIRLSEFGFAEFVKENNKYEKELHTILGSPLYMSPQILNGEEYSAKCDIWSTGITFYQMLHGFAPWRAHSKTQLEMKIRSDPLIISDKLRTETKELIIQMLANEEEDRISWREVLTKCAFILDKIKTEKSEGNGAPEK